MIATAGLMGFVLTSCAVKSPEASGSGPRSFHGVPLSPNVTCGDPACRSYNVMPYVRDRSRYGIGCLGNVPPGTVANAKPPPQSYATDDVGKPGFPQLLPGERELVARIRRYDDSKTLRIAWLSNATAPTEFIVFDATDGPCEVEAAGYAVLNGACNEFYQPGENPYDTHPAPGCYPTHRPWMR